jgi:uncharacterized surface protein with fasciclin (FAS1) repeats
MKKSILIVAVSFSISLISSSLFAQTPQKSTTPATPAPKTTMPVTPTPAVTTPAVKDTSAKDATATIEDVASLTTFASAIKAANLEAELKGAGPFTVFAPDNTAFNTISKGKLDSLLKDPVKLPVAVNVYVVAGKYGKTDLIKAYVAGKGTATLKTVDGQTLSIGVKDKKLQLTDSQGNTAQVTSFDTPVTNGVIHGINGVLMYK